MSVLWLVMATFLYPLWVFRTVPVKCGCGSQFHPVSLRGCPDIKQETGLRNISQADPKSSSLRHSQGSVEMADPQPKAQRRHWLAHGVTVALPHNHLRCMSCWRTFPGGVCQRSACTKVKHKRASVPGLAAESLPLSSPGFRFPDAAYEATIN